MAESAIDAPNIDKMGQRDSLAPALEVSVSFGRYENDSLSWEKWSTFSPNKYLEEVEKCATPGSVAQKKAYFEAHYKKIAERKTELAADQEKQIESKLLRPTDQECQDRNNVALAADSQHSASNELSAHATGQNAMEFINGGSETEIKQPNGETASGMEDQSLMLQAVKEEVDNHLDTPKMEKPEEVHSVKQENESKDVANDILSKNSQGNDETQNQEKNMHSIGSQKIDGKHDSEKAKEVAKKSKERSMKIDGSKGSPKVSQPARKSVAKQTTPFSKERNATCIKKKPASPAPRVPGFTTPKVSKTSSTQLSMSQSSMREKVSTLPRSKYSSGSLGKQMAPKSLHMSLSLSPGSSDPPPLMTNRKSLIMEKMGDKDIVKRAFKTFQSRLKSPSVEQSAAPKQSPATVTTETSSTTSRTESRGSLKTSSAAKKMAKAAPSSGTKSHESTQRIPTILRKTGKKSNISEATRSQHPKSKDAREPEFKRLTQSLNYKATPAVGLLRISNVSKGSPIKEGSITEGRD